MDEQRSRDNWQRRMREEWDERAKENALAYTSRGFDPTEDLDTVFRRARDETISLTRPVFSRLGFDPGGKRILDIGCGIGRSFPGFAALGFSEIWGIDVSPGMIEQGRRLCPVPSAHFVPGNGQDLSGLESNCFDYCFSYFVFENIPDPRIVWCYLEDMERILRRGGAFQLHFRGRHLLKARIALLIPPRFRRSVQISYRLLTLSWLNGRPVRPQPVPGTLETRWGTPVPAGQVVRKLVELGFVNVEVLADPPGRSGKPGTHFWAVGRKP